MLVQRRVRIRDPGHRLVRRGRGRVEIGLGRRQVADAGAASLVERGGGTGELRLGGDVALECDRDVLPQSTETERRHHGGPPGPAGGAGGDCGGGSRSAARIATRTGCW